MSTKTAVVPRIAGTRVAPGRAGPTRLGPPDLFILSAWFGLAGGLLEVLARVVGKSLFSRNQLYMMTRHFYWLGPLSNLLFFTVLGLLLVLATPIWPRFVRWLSPRLIGLLAIAPILIVLAPKIYGWAWAIFALGAALRLAPVLERHAATLRRRLLVTFPVLVALLVALAGWVIGGQAWAEWREAARPMPRGQPPNVLLITLDTVRADHLGLYGYARPTSPVLDTIAKAGIRFDEARAVAPWTVPSHAAMFTGRWPHELGVRWQAPLRRDVPTLAECLGSRGYATAGFVANAGYCSYDSGLDRGFTRYDDYALPHLLPFRTAWLVDRAVRLIGDIGSFIGRTFDVGPLRPLQESWLSPCLVDLARKDAGTINRDFTDWLARRSQPERPFFAFLNYYDAHAPYVLPVGAEYRFERKPRRAQDFIFLTEYWESLDRTELRPAYRDLARDSYDNCLAYLDEQLGLLLRELFGRGVLDHTWLIITADHGEGMGEHRLFDHGESLYRPEIHVPLVILPPSGSRVARVVRQCVSLRDLPATILDVTGQAGDSPFPGRSLQPLWRDPIPDEATSGSYEVLSELASPNPYDPNQGRSPAVRGPLVSVAQGDYVYILNRGDGREELYSEREDPGEERDLSRVETMRPVLERLRRRLEELHQTGPPADRVRWVGVESHRTTPPRG